MTEGDEKMRQEEMRGDVEVSCVCVGDLNEGLTHSANVTIQPRHSVNFLALGLICQTLSTSRSCYLGNL